MILTGNWSPLNPKADRILINWQPVEFDTLPGWQQDDHNAAFSCFQMSARALADISKQTRPGLNPPQELLEVGDKALKLNSDTLGRSGAREFFEKYFLPHSISSSNGFVTGYYEPELEASRNQSDEYFVPVYGRPKDLVAVTTETENTDLPHEYDFGRLADGRIIEYFDREQIENGALDCRQLAHFWLKSSVDAFFMHIQGSARLVLSDGKTARVSYAGKSGHPYTSIGKLLVDRGELTLADADMQGIREWLENNPERGRSLMKENRSFIFFEEVSHFEPELGPVAAAGVPLTAGRSIAVDKGIHAYGLPIWISTEIPLPQSSNKFARLMIAQDTGSAIVGPKRGDLFIGSGTEAGSIAGTIRHKAGFFVFKPRTIG